MNTKVKSNVFTPSIGQLAREALDNAKGDVDAAVISLSTRILNDPVIFDRFVRPLCEQECRVYIRAANRTTRLAIWKRTDGDSNDRLQSVASQLLMNMPLPSGILLGQAQKEDLVSAASFYTKQAETMRQLGQFFSAISDKIPADTYVDEHFTEKQLSVIKAQVT